MHTPSSTPPARTILNHRLNPNREHGYLKHVFRIEPMTLVEVREALGMHDSYVGKWDGKPFDGLMYDKYIHNRIKGWNKNINLCDREQVMEAWVRAHNFDLWHMGMRDVSNIHQKLKEAKPLTDEERALIEGWNGTVPAEYLAAHGLKERIKGPMCWAAFAAYLKHKNVP